MRWIQGSSTDSSDSRLQRERRGLDWVDWMWNSDWGGVREEAADNRPRPPILVLYLMTGLDIVAHTRLSPYSISWPLSLLPR